MAKKKDPEDALGFQVTVRLDAELASRAAALVAKLGGVTSRVAILREAMRLGMDVLEERYRQTPSASTSPKNSKKR